MVKHIVKACDINTERFLDYIWQFFNIMYERVNGVCIWHGFISWVLLLFAIALKEPIYNASFHSQGCFNSIYVCYNEININSTRTHSGSLIHIRELLYWKLLRRISLVDMFTYAKTGFVNSEVNEIMSLNRWPCK